MPAIAKPMPPAELAALEHAFAADPASEAYRALTEAYLSMGRFMEAMVVCKKGAKAHPKDPSPRFLLARVYGAQGKDQKALEELGVVLELAPRHGAANRMMGLLQLKLGEKELGVAALRKAWESDPDDPETVDTLKKWGLTFTVAPPPPPPAPPPAAADPGSPGGPVAHAVSTGGAAAPPPMPVGSSAAGHGAAAPSPTPPPVAPRNTAYAEELASRYSTREYPIPSVPVGSRKLPKSVVVTAALGGVLLLALAVWGGVGVLRKRRAVEIDRLLRQTRELLEKDSYASYKEAAKHCERILEVDSDAVGGHAYLAYIDAVRFGEHGESEGLRDDAKKHLEAVARLGLNHSHAYAAQTYLRFYAGDGKGAIEELKKVLDGPEGASSLLHGVLGVIEMQAGDLDGARSDLTLARNIAPGDVRITQMLAEQWRRRGQGFEIQATALYDTALTRLAPDHVPSLLGKAQLLLDGGRADEAQKRINKVLEMGPGASPRQVAMAHALRGTALHAQGRGRDGDAEEEKALALDPANPDIHDLIARRKLRSGDVAGAVEGFNRAIQIDGNRLGFYVDLASALMQRPGGAKQAIASLETASARVSNPRVTKLLGDAYRGDGDVERARAAYEKASAMDKKYPEAHIALGRLYREKGDPTRAREEFTRALGAYGQGTSGNAAAAWVEIGETEETRGKVAEADEAYRSAIKADPQSCPALFWLGRTRSDRRSNVYNRPLAAQMLNDYLRLCPRGPRVPEAQRLVASLR